MKWREGKILNLLLKSERDLTPISRHNFPLTFTWIGIIKPT
jgi:hypothetical protein